MGIISKVVESVYYKNKKEKPKKEKKEKKKKKINMFNFAISRTRVIKFIGVFQHLMP